jgi:thiol-disulfide isomerase/thioredoxin
MKKIILCAVFALMAVAEILAQDKGNKTITPLAVGDTVPEITLKHIINYKSPSAKLSDFKGKLLILDFWATFCTPCVDALPTVNKLNQKFEGKAFILPVTSSANHDYESKIRATLAKINLPDLPSVIDGDLLDNYFPHRLIPHEVWIDSNGKVIAITNGEEVNEENILNALSNAGLPKMQQKTDQLSFDAGKPLLVNGNAGADSAVLYRSILTKYIDGIGGGEYYNNGKKLTGNIYRGFNTNMYMMFARTFAGELKDFGGSFNVKSTIIEADGKSYMMTTDQYNKETPWSEKSKWYNYNLILPKHVSDSLFFRKYMLEDLNRFFEYTGSVQKRVVPILVITQLKGQSAKFPLSKATTGIHQMVEEGGKLIKIENESFNEFVAFLRKYPDTPPIINETKYADERVDMDLGLKTQLDDAWNKALDLPAVKAILNKYGLDIVEKTGPAEVLVLTKKKNW